MTGRVTNEYVMWGFHPSYTGPLGVVPIKLAGGTLNQSRAAQRSRKREGGWTLAIYRAGTSPEGLRAQCREQYGAPSETLAVSREEKVDTDLAPEHATPLEDPDYQPLQPPVNGLIPDVNHTSEHRGPCCRTCESDWEGYADDLGGRCCCKALASEGKP